MSPRLLAALTLTTAAAWRFPGLARPKEEDVIEATPTGPRELSIETHDYEAHESTMVLPFEDTHACLLQSLKDYLDTHGETFESKIMLKIGLSRRPGNREIGDCYPSTPSRRLRVTKRSPAGGHRVDSNAADYFRMMPDGVCARRPTFLRRGDGVRGGTATLPYAIDAQVISKTLIHLMERPPGRTSRHIERIIGSQKTLRLQDLLILATDTESLHPDIDTDIVLLFSV